MVFLERLFKHLLVVIQVGAKKWTFFWFVFVLDKILMNLHQKENEKIVWIKITTFFKRCVSIIL